MKRCHKLWVWAAFSVVLGTLFVGSGARAQSSTSTKEDASLRLGAYAETYFQWNFNRPSNGITNYRGFDNRHDTFTLSNIALGVAWDHQRVLGQLSLQVGSTPSTYYLAEPQHEGTSGANASSGALWKYLQQAYLGYRFVDLEAHELTVSAGLFLSPIGPESMAVKDNWNWSNSNLFFGLPFYHTGARATYTLRDRWGFSLAVYNGWNSVVDNNRQKSLAMQVTYADTNWNLSLLYFGGVERARGAPEGQPFRHLFDTHATWRANTWLSLMAELNAGFEPTHFGASRWVAGALYARARLLSEVLFFAVRGDAFNEHVPSAQGGRATSLFWPVSWVSSGTATLDYRPHPHLSLRAEYRHDQAAGAMYFGGQIRRDSAEAFVANRRSQDTITLGATAWY